MRLNQSTSDDFPAAAARDNSSLSQEPNNWSSRGTFSASGRQREDDDGPNSLVGNRLGSDFLSLHNPDKRPSVSVLDSVSVPYADDSTAASPVDVTLTPSVMTLEETLGVVSPLLLKKRPSSLVSAGCDRKLFRRNLLAPGFHSRDRKREPTYFRWTGFRQRPVSQLLPRDLLSVS